MSEQPGVLDVALAPRDRFIHFRTPLPGAQLSLIQCGHMETPARYGYGPMMRDHYLIHFVRSGYGRLFVQDSVYELGAGQCFLIYPSQIGYYEADSGSPWVYEWVGFSGESAEALLAHAGFSPECLALPIGDAENVFFYLARMIESISLPDSRLLLDGMLYAVLYHMSYGKRHGAPHARAPVPVRRGENLLGKEYAHIVISIIETSYREHLTVTRIASMLGLNRSYLTDLFRAQTGMPIKAYLTQYRLSIACNLLQYSAMPIMNVARESGFADPLYFSRVFHEHIGEPPLSFRARFQAHAHGIAPSAEPFESSGHSK